MWYTEYHSKICSSDILEDAKLNPIQTIQEIVTIMGNKDKLQEVVDEKIQLFSTLNNTWWNSWYFAYLFNETYTGEDFYTSVATIIVRGEYMFLQLIVHFRLLKLSFDPFVQK